MIPQISQTDAEREVRALYAALLDRWNSRNAADFAMLFEEDGNQVGFDGSQINGRAEIEFHLRQIFTNHATAAYVGIVREVRFLSRDVALLRATAGMIPHGKTDIDPAVNAIQSLVARKQGEEWRVALFHNTPAQFHGQPELSEQLTEELRAALKK